MNTQHDSARKPGFGVYLRAAGSIALNGLASSLLIPWVIVSACLVVVLAGIPMLAGCLAIIRSMSNWMRCTASRILGIPGRPPYRPVTGESVPAHLRSRLSDPAGYRDLLWLIIAGIFGFPLGIVALVLSLAVPFGLYASFALVRIYLTVGSFVLRRNNSDEALLQRIGELSTTRAETVDSQAAEIRRIERDLHDGAQARLVAMSMNLGLAEKLMQSDPAASAELIAESRESASAALTDLRGLVRGIHPPVLADRGLIGGLEALALSAAMKVELDLALAGRAPAPVESAVYFAVAEALTNAAKYSSASTAWIWMRHYDGRLRLSVGDAGIGGAVAKPGGGLHGIERRLAAFDGTVTVASPRGGPTIISMELPCPLSASSSGKI